MDDTLQLDANVVDYLLVAAYFLFALLYLRGFQHNPWRAHRVKVPFRDLLRLIWGGLRTGWTLHELHRDYPPEARAACGRDGGG